MRKASLKGNFLLALIFSLVTIGSELAYYGINENLENRVPFSSMLKLSLAIFLFSFIRRKSLRFIAMGMIFALNYLQMIHQEFFGTSLISSELYIPFTIPYTLGYEVKSMLLTDMSFLFLPSLITFLGILILLYFSAKINALKSLHFMPFLFAFYLAFNPLRTYLTGNNWGKQPAMDEFGGMNFYTSISYFLGKILPSKLGGTLGSGKAIDLKFLEKQSLVNNVIVVFGETLTHRHMSLFGYSRDTTPFLKSIKDKIFYSSALSVGVSTDITIPFFINNTYGLNSNMNIVSGRNCLFRFAKEKDYDTYFHTVQVDQQMKYIVNSICPKFIDQKLTFSELFTHDDPNRADDMVLIDTLDKIDFSKKNFIMLHQRGSHTPYEKRIFLNPPPFAYEKGINKKIIDYDNSVFEFDRFMKKLYEKIMPLKQKVDVIYISDHGEALGEEGSWGHGKLTKYSYEVPVLLFNNYGKEYQLERPLTHISVSAYISKLLGFELQNYDYKRFTTLGSDLDGFSGYIDFEFEDGKIKSVKTVK